MDYVFYLRDRINQNSDPSRKFTVQGYLIASQIKPEDRQWKDTAKQSEVYVRTWDSLLGTAEHLYGEFLDLVKSKAPADDPRIQAINSLQTENTQ